MKTFTLPQFAVLSFLSIFFLQVNAQIVKTSEPRKSVITAFSATPDGKRMALGGNASIEIMDTETDVIIYNLPLSSRVIALSLRHDGNALVFALDNQVSLNNLLYWDFQSGARISVIHSHTDKIICVAISPDGKLIATGSKDNTIRLFETEYLREIQNLPMHHSGDVTTLSFSPDSKLLLSGSKDKNVVLWDLETIGNIKIFQGNSKKVNAVAFSPDGKFIASGGDDMFIRIWDLYNIEKPIYVLRGHGRAINTIDFTPDGRFLGSASDDHKIRLWEYKTTKMLDLKNGIANYIDEPVKYMSFYEGGRLFTVDGGRSVKYWIWGFPILSIRDIKMDDHNKNNILEGTEEVKITFDIVNSGEGSAMKLKFDISELSKVEELTFPTHMFIETIPPRSVHTVEMNISSTEKLKSALARFSFTDFSMISQSPYALKDTTFTVKTMAAPSLKIDTIRFIYPDTSSSLTGNKSGVFNIYLKNSGVGIAKDVMVKTTCDKSTSMVEFEEITPVGNISNVSTQVLKIPVKATTRAIDGMVNFRFSITESTGISSPSSIMAITTSKYIPSLIDEIKEIVENKIITWQAKSKWETTEEYKTRVTESSRDLQIAALTQQTIDSLVKDNLNWSYAVTDYDADNTSYKIALPKFDPIFLNIPRAEAEVFDARFKHYKLENMSYTVNKNNFAFLHFELEDTLAMNKKYYYNSSDMVAFSPTLLNFSFEPVNISAIPRSTNAFSSGEARQISVGSSDVDRNIPEVVVSNPNIFAVVIGNEDYKRYQMGLKSESNVEFAEKDAETFANYLQSTYGVPKDNIRLHKNATYATMNQDLSWLSSLAANSHGNAELIFYFSGHGLPDENTSEGYLIPVDVAGSNLKLAIKLSNLYAELSKFPTKKVTVFLDACFSGGGRTEGLLASKSVKIKPKDETINGNLVVFTSSSGDESSGFYKDKQHGLFTYYLLKKIQETKGSVDYQSLFEYLKREVNIKSLTVNNKEQNPQMIVSSEFPVDLTKVRIGPAATSEE